MEVDVLRFTRNGFGIWVLFIWISVIGSVFSRTISMDPDPCDSNTEMEFYKLKQDQITVLINGYSESRIPLLQSIVASYSASPIVSSILVLWGNPSTQAQVLDQLFHNLTQHSLGTASISLIQQPSSSLNARFIPRPSIDTRAVLICDDDVEIDRRSLEFAFKVWKSNADSLVGVFPRSHDFDLTSKGWMYTVHPDKYSIVLTKFMMMKQDYLFEYSCRGGRKMEEMRKIVDEMGNCEDILMNFVAADETRAGPVMVGAERVRDWGDPRNEGGEYRDGEEERVREVGLSSRRREHRKRRGRCIREFHRVMGRMPLRYSYGKVVNSVGEQGLCNKAGKLVFCDQR
ncbi:PREDICTED: glycosyltransferase family protein 64 C3 [Tarenaya hassleriana]|uniref:glycosyltransferase family protein 64 C3 n=1 Tax=Tarenaya hassleriana TaxID=28532 RepID=UPI00053C6978|nr:PREDICTED: glycosyltransferase family protein 64 C3 [Tarenaya hassleriana]